MQALFSTFFAPTQNHRKTNTLRHPHPTPIHPAPQKPAQNWVTTKQQVRRSRVKKRTKRKGTQDLTTENTKNGTPKRQPLEWLGVLGLSNAGAWGRAPNGPAGRRGSASLQRRLANHRHAISGDAQRAPSPGWSVPRSRGVGRAAPPIYAGVPVPNRAYKRVCNVRSRRSETAFRREAGRGGGCED